MALLNIVAANAVKEKDYFLSFMNNPWVINGIRIIAVIVFVAFIVTYLKYRKK